jgi:hypothetical protein
MRVWAASFSSWVCVSVSLIKAISCSSLWVCVWVCVSVAWVSVKVDWRVAVVVRACVWVWVYGCVGEWV